MRGLLLSKEGFTETPTDTESLLHLVIFTQPEHGLHGEQRRHHKGDTLGHCDEREERRGERKGIIFLPLEVL